MVIYFYVDCYVLHNCIHISLSMAWRIISLGFIPCVCWDTSRMFLFVLLDHVFLLHTQLALFFQPIFTYYMSEKCLQITPNVLTLSVKNILSIIWNRKIYRHNYQHRYNQKINSLFSENNVCHSYGPIHSSESVSSSHSPYYLNVSHSWSHIYQVPIYVHSYISTNHNLQTIVLCLSNHILHTQHFQHIFVSSYAFTVHICAA